MSLKPFLDVSMNGKKILKPQLCCGRGQEKGCFKLYSPRIQVEQMTARKLTCWSAFYIHS